ncbi:MAG: hypothetical protein KF688_03890 [Pirellulales bacterium]|nr:hypothetical protein [Pirellulales bacterium]
MLLSPTERPPTYRAPADDGGLLSVPAWDELPALAQQGALLDAAPVEIGGVSLGEFRRQAKAELALLAHEYVAEYADAPARLDPAAPIVVAGHQPELIHAGVWLKNFAASELAGRLGGGAINLVIDSDAAHGATIRVPAGDPATPRFELLPFDAPCEPIAWEERRVIDAATWQSFGARAVEAMRPWGVDPLARTWWPTVLASRGTPPGLALAQARHALEIEWGARTLELPQSAVGRSHSFRRFACVLLAELPRLVAAYNGALAEFRRIHRIRNHAHPAPNLATDGRWFEAPFWSWSTSDPTRRPLFARRIGDEVEIADRGRFVQRLPLGGSGDCDTAIDVLAACEARGVKIRSRAMATTLFARLALADLFIHGIGGARYDEATDAISREFFGLTPAPYAAMTGTLRLPIPLPREADAEINTRRRDLRDLRFHPERFLAGADLDAEGDRVAAVLVAEKRRWIAAEKSPANARARHLGIEGANQALAALLADVRGRTTASLEAARQRARAGAILGSREYAFCLFPHDRLQQFLLDFPRRLP